MTVKIYDSNQVSIMFAGRPISGGYADGEFVRVEFSNDGFTKVIGTDGEVTRSKSNDQSARVTISLMQSADANNILSALFNLDVLTPNGAGVAPIYIRDRSGLSLYEGESAWIVKMPDSSFDKGPTARQWLIDVANLKAFVGGN